MDRGSKYARISHSSGTSKKVREKGKGHSYTRVRITSMKGIGRMI